MQLHLTILLDIYIYMPGHYRVTDEALLAETT